MPRNTILDDTGLPREVCDIVLDQFGRKSGQLRLLLSNIGDKDTSTAIRNDDFQILRTVSTIVASFAASATVIGWAPAAIANLVALLYDFRKKSIKLSALQAVLIKELKAYPNLTASEIASGLQLHGLTTEDIQSELLALTKMARADNVVVSLVSSNENGQWQAVDV